MSTSFKYNNRPVASKNSQQHLFKVVLYKKHLILDSLFHAKAAR